ncbi:MAG: hypothetical protein LIP03_11750 [Bacteroidales bacterium]|nr:hypothetical protein [Bacteroidales bacterium]
MNKVRIVDITTLLGQDLRLRNTVVDGLLYVNNCDEDKVVIDFKNVKFATRSFIDEYYNTFVLKRIGHCKPEVETINVPSDIQYIFNVVSKTQTRKRVYEEVDRSHVHRFNTLEEMRAWFKTLSF